MTTQSITVEQQQQSNAKSITKQSQVNHNAITNQSQSNQKTSQAKSFNRNT
jgi:hypothetical protein